MEYFNGDSHQERLNRCNSLRQEPSTPTSWGDNGDDGVDDNDDADVDDDDVDDDDVEDPPVSCLQKAAKATVNQQGDQHLKTLDAAVPHKGPSTSTYAHTLVVVDP